MSKNQYDRAIQDFDQAIRLDSRDAAAFRGRGNAYYANRECGPAIQDYTEAIRLSPSDVSVLAARGYANFYLGRFDDAQQDLSKAVDSNPNNTYPVIWLYLAVARSGLNGRAELEKSAAQLKPTAWPAPVIDLYLGKATAEMVLSAANDKDPKKDREQHCEAYFYLGEYALVSGKADEARRLFRQAIDTSVTNFVEYRGAQEELKRISSEAPRLTPSR